MRGGKQGSSDNLRQSLGFAADANSRVPILEAVSESDEAELDLEAYGLRKPQRYRRNRWTCCCYSLVATLLALVLLALCYLIIDPQEPVIEVARTKLLSIHAYTERKEHQLLPRVKLDIELLIELSVQNSNIIGFKYDHVRATVGYREENVGHVDTFEGGRVGSFSRKLVSADLKLKGAEILQNGAALLADVARREVPIQLNSTVYGSVGVLFWKWSPVVNTTCNLKIDPVKSYVLEEECSTVVGL